MRRKELFYYVTSGSNFTRDVHWCVTVFYQQIENSNVANQIYGFAIDYGKFMLYLEGREREISFILADFLFHPRPRKFRNVPCFECKLRTMSYYGVSQDFWKQSCSWIEV